MKVKNTDNINNSLRYLQQKKAVFDENKKDKFIIEGLGGKKKLNGKIAVAGAKSAALPALSASILFRNGFCVSNIPNIKDIDSMNILLEKLGAIVKKQAEKKYHIVTDEIKSVALDIEISKKMGAKVQNRNGKYVVSVGKNKKLKGAKIFFNKITVTGTETLMLAGILAKGRTVIENAALEPEIKHLADFLNSCGAKIRGAGTSTIEIIGGNLLSAGNRVYKIPPDRIEAGSFLILGALSADNLEITDCDPKHMRALINILRDSGVPIIEEKNKIIIKDNGKIKNKHFKCIDIKTHEYPGFPTDLQPPMAI